MKPSQRLQELLALLSNKQATTAEELSTELSVSPRTIYRDISTLREQGHVISTDTGPGGGVRLDQEKSPSAVRLTGDELVSLWLSAQLSRLANGLPWGNAAKHALQKLMESIPRERARELRALHRRVIVGGPATQNVRQGAGEPPPELLGYFERAFRLKIAMEFHYKDRLGQESYRRVEPHGLLVEVPVWYILARDVHKQEARSFRMDRISRPKLCHQHPFQPAETIIGELTAHLREGCKSP